MPLTTQIELITPEIAKEYLKKNSKNNRLLKQNIVDKYARDMLAGNWKLTHEGIAFDENGELNDGSHRLTAIVKSGVSIPMPVTRGLSADAMAVIDQGCKRSTYDQLRILNPGDDIYCNKDVHAYVKFISYLPCLTGKPKSLSNNEIYELIKEYHGICKLLKIKKTTAIDIPTFHAIVCARICGISSYEAELILDYLKTNRITSDNYNWKALIDFKQNVIQKVYGSGGVQRLKKFKDMKRSIFLFINNKKFSREDDFYVITKEMLKEFSDNTEEEVE